MLFSVIIGVRSYDRQQGKRLHKINVRPFDPDDADVVAAMMGELAAFHGDELRATASDLIRSTFGAQRMTRIWVASGDKELFAFAATYDWMNFVRGFPVRHIDLFFVRERMRGDGIGRALLTTIVTDAKRSACQRVTVGTQPDNEGAIAFYTKMGFEIRRPAPNQYALSGAALDHLAGA